ncbi:MAG TPA: LLM class flavin-dependent oxidoreductase [Mycobacteriales bacterium]|nr:LLM class flavin-dependent oxidoreductase [Mycobacteriales bacterium]
MYTLRFDLRSPAGATPTAELYRAALDMCAWGEQHGALAAVLSEHHGSPDGYLPAAIVFASAVAARTERLGIILAALVVPLYDPVRLAEELSVLDNVSRGRVSAVLAVGHRDEEYEHFGIDARTRGRVADEHLALLLELFTGEPVVHDGRRIHLTPAPFTAGGPALMVGGASAPAVRRAARFGLGFIGQAAPPGLAELYAEACRAYGREPGPILLPDPVDPTTIFIADDVDAAWDELGPHLLYDAQAAAAWRPGEQVVASISRAGSVEEMRAWPGPYRIFTPEQARAHQASGKSIGLHPLCAGLPVEMAWRYLRRAAEALA